MLQSGDSPVVRRIIASLPTLHQRSRQWPAMVPIYLRCACSQSYPATLPRQVILAPARGAVRLLFTISKSTPAFDLAGVHGYAFRSRSDARSDGLRQLVINSGVCVQRTRASSFSGTTRFGSLRACEKIGFMNRLGCGGHGSVRFIGDEVSNRASPRRNPLPLSRPPERFLTIRRGSNGFE